MASRWPRGSHPGPSPPHRRPDLEPRCACLRRSGGAGQRPRLHLEGAACPAPRSRRSLADTLDAARRVPAAADRHRLRHLVGVGRLRTWTATHLAPGPARGHDDPGCRHGGLGAAPFQQSRTAACHYGLVLVRGQPLGETAPDCAWPTALVAPVLAEALLASHRAPLAHALLGFPTGRLATSRREVGGWGCLRQRGRWSIWSFGSGALIIAAVAAGATFVAYRQAAGQRRRAKLLALQVATALAVAVAAGVALRTLCQARSRAGTPALRAGSRRVCRPARCRPRPPGVGGSDRRRSSSSSSARSGPATCAMPWRHPG